MTTTKNTKENRKVVRAEYSAPESVFEIPDGLDLEDKSIVEWWGVKWNTLHIKYVGKEEVEDIQPSWDGGEDHEIWKHPNDCGIEDAEDVGYEYEEDEDLPKLNCVHCEKHIERDSEDHDNVHINEKDEIICQDCLDKCDCEYCEDEEEEKENMDICGESGGEISGYEGCKISLPTEDTNMLGNTSFCITCYEKYESKYYENDNVEEIETECMTPPRSIGDYELLKCCDKDMWILHNKKKDEIVTDFDDKGLALMAFALLTQKPFIEKDEEEEEEEDIERDYWVAGDGCLKLITSTERKISELGWDEWGVIIGDVCDERKKEE